MNNSDQREREDRKCITLSRDSKKNKAECYLVSDQREIQGSGVFLAEGRRSERRHRENSRKASELGPTERRQNTSRQRESVRGRSER
ncbi:unnamed protein product [Ilex paraguariensis]|uniref:Uncharacterized protein n=1 Tax=Ilex paraguariensis TaxID=185542 RepID=A0ABC8QZK4_9AQUA